MPPTPLSPFLTPIPPPPSFPVSSAGPTYLIEHPTDGRFVPCRPVVSALDIAALEDAMISAAFVRPLDPSSVAATGMSARAALTTAMVILMNREVNKYNQDHGRRDFVGLASPDVVERIQELVEDGAFGVVLAASEVSEPNIGRWTHEGMLNGVAIWQSDAMPWDSFTIALPGSVGGSGCFAVQREQWLEGLEVFPSMLRFVFQDHYLD